MLVDRTHFASLVPALADLFERCFGKRLPEAFFRWRYVDNPVGRVFADVVLDEAGERVLANYSVCPVWMLSPQGERVLSALSMTTMVDEALRGQGLFARQCASLTAQLAEADFSLLWGFPNEASFGGFVRKLGWHHLRAFAQLSAAVPRAATAPDEVLRDDDFGLDYDDLATRIAPGLLRVHRTSEYLRWRYRDNPLNAYGNVVIADGGHATASCVFKTFNDALDVVDIMVPDAETLAPLLTAIAAAAIERGLGRINCWMPEHHPLFAALLDARFVPTEPVTRIGGRHPGAADARCPLRFEQWYLQMGDSDVY